MYGWFWRRLSGSPGARLAATAMIVTLIGVLLWYVVYPWLSLHLPLDRPGIG